ncbi:MAG TPA: SIS domain-containing protein [Thermomicrobiales bacterium]|jgi:D-sedoheptulose 7-phosphate isomerase
MSWNDPAMLSTITASLPDAAAGGGRHHQPLTVAIAQRRAQLDEALDQLQHCASTLAEVAARVVEALDGGHKVLVAGNGGSAAEAQHFAAELVGRFRRERAPYAVIALTADSAALTAIANDYGYQEVFARQVRGLGQRGDLLLLFSTSGESENLVRAAYAARQCGLATVAIVGARPCRLAEHATLAVRVPASETTLVQELHQVVTHLLCEVIEAELARAEAGETVALPPPFAGQMDGADLLEGGR